MLTFEDLTLSIAIRLALLMTWAVRTYRNVFPRCAPATPRVTPWSERTPAEIAAWEDAQWARAIKRMAYRMAPVHAGA